jgi:divalent metal cation (Fe/Co/Zn/Cd) transporter
MRSRSVTVGLVLFAAGVVVALFVLSRLVFEQAPLVPVLWFLAMLSGVGFAVLLGWLWVQSRRRRREIRAAVSAPRRSNPA